MEGIGRGCVRLRGPSRCQPHDALVIERQAALAIREHAEPLVHRNQRDVVGLIDGRGQRSATAAARRARLTSPTRGRRGPGRRIRPVWTGLASVMPAFIFTARLAAAANRSRLRSKVPGKAQLPCGEPVAAAVQHEVHLRVFGERLGDGEEPRHRQPSWAAEKSRSALPLPSFHRVIRAR